MKTDVQAVVPAVRSSGRCHRARPQTPLSLRLSSLCCRTHFLNSEPGTASVTTLQAQLKQTSGVIQAMKCSRQHIEETAPQTRHEILAGRLQSIEVRGKETEGRSRNGRQSSHVSIELIVRACTYA